jgi:hypothetical protein
MSVAKNFINIERFESGRLNKGETTRTAWQGIWYLTWKSLATPNGES